MSSLVFLGTSLAITPPSVAQEPSWAQVRAEVVPAWTAADPVPGGGGLTELRLVQPVVMMRAGALQRFRLIATLNLEGATIPGGELAPGNWGEGFVDRRHPHTYVHELLLVGDLLHPKPGGVRISLAAGKGFAPFGTDDPMVRPVLRYPVNHHLAQILERAVAIASARRGPLALELGLFNGDEPERPGQWPRVGGRFGDSWAVRLTASPLHGLELQGSHALVRSPEHRPGAGTDQRKWSTSARWERPVGRSGLYALVEWARTSEAGGFFVFRSLLAEGAWTRGAHRLHYRFERTERPEEERLSLFRSLRPHLENSILGISRWTTHTGGYSLGPFAVGPLVAQPLLELSLGRIAKVGNGLFDVAELYGDDAFWSGTLGIRMALGGERHRMGRYGAAQEREPMRSARHGAER